jgi:hypothetical protein
MSLFSRWLRRTGPCRCGHTDAAHAHYRDGGQCCSCPQDACTQYRPVSVWGRFQPTASDGHGDRAHAATTSRPLPAPDPYHAARWAAYGKDIRHNARRHEATAALAKEARNTR